MRELFAPYGRWAGLAGAHALRAGAGAGSLRATPRSAMAGGRTHAGAAALDPSAELTHIPTVGVGFLLGYPN